MYNLPVLHLHHQMLRTALNGANRGTYEPALEVFRKRKTKVRSTLLYGDQAAARPSLCEATTNGLDLWQFRHWATSPQQRGDACLRTPQD